jgi:hypothetical protein
MGDYAIGGLRGREDVHCEMMLHAFELTRDRCEEELEEGRVTIDLYRRGLKAAVSRSDRVFGACGHERRQEVANVSCFMTREKTLQTRWLRRARSTT